MLGAVVYWSYRYGRTVYIYIHIYIYACISICMAAVCQSVQIEMYVCNLSKDFSLSMILVMSDTLYTCTPPRILTNIKVQMDYMYVRSEENPAINYI